MIIVKYMVILKIIELNFLSVLSDGSEDGLKEDEYEASVATLQSLAATLEADCVLLRQSKADHGLTGQYLVRRRLDRQDFLEIRYLYYHSFWIDNMLN